MKEIVNDHMIDRAVMEVAPSFIRQFSDLSGVKVSSYEIARQVPSSLDENRPLDEICLIIKYRKS